MLVWTSSCRKYNRRGVAPVYKKTEIQRMRVSGSETSSRNNESVFGEDALQMDIYCGGYRRKYEIIYSSILAYGDEQHYLKQVDQKKYTVDRMHVK